jgi:hypothetical protein
VESSFDKSLVVLALRVFLAGESTLLVLCTLPGDPLSLLGVSFVGVVVDFAELERKGLLVVASTGGDLGGD